jgi:hypothetical protein
MAIPETVRRRSPIQRDRELAVAVRRGPERLPNGLRVQPQGDLQTQSRTGREYVLHYTAEPEVAYLVAGYR